MARYDSDNYIPERNYMARFDPGDETEMVPMRPPAPQGYAGPPRGYPDDETDSRRGDGYARNGDPRYPPGQRYDPEPRYNHNYPPQVQFYSQTVYHSGFGRN